MTERIVNVDRLEDLIAVFGSFDENIKRIEEAFTVAIVNRGTELHVTGEVEAADKDKENWAKSAMLNVACSGKFTSDRTIQEYVDEIWHLDKVILK